MDHRSSVVCNALLAASEFWQFLARASGTLKVGFEGFEGDVLIDCGRLGLPS